MAKRDPWTEAKNAVREYLIEHHDNSPDGKLQQLINLLDYGLLYGPMPVEDVREECPWYPGWSAGCEVLGAFVEDMPRTLWVDLGGDTFVMESEPDASYKCDACDGTGECDSLFQPEDETEDDRMCSECNGTGYLDNYLEETYEVDTREALLGSRLKGYEDTPDYLTHRWIAKFWPAPAWKVARMMATERRRVQIAKRKT